MVRKEHLSLIAKHSLRHGVRGGAGLVSIALTLLVGLFMAQCAVGPLESADKTIDFAVDRSRGKIDDNQRAAAKKEANQQLAKLAVGVMKLAIDPSDKQLEYWTEDKPAMVSVLLVLLFMAAPFFACLGGFNQTAGDIGSKGLRFLLFRTERSNIFWGRFLGTLAFTAVVNLVLFLILTVYLVAKIKIHPGGDMALWMLQGYLRMMIFVLPYVALCAWISAAQDSAFASLAIALVIAFFVPLFFGIASGMQEQVKYAQFLTPWGFKYWLLEPIGPKLFAGLGAMAGFTSLFLWLGHRTFNKRDL
jgi:ABC-type transport system involved in multi-copper enzyme maturation permease subunit